MSFVRLALVAALPSRALPGRAAPPKGRRRGHGRPVALALLVAIVTLGLGWQTGTASATDYFPIDGEGSSWSANAIDQWISDVQQYGMQVSFDPDGSTTGRQDYLKGLTDFAASDIPFQTDPQDGSAPEDPQAGTYAYMPITSGGTAFMYNLEVAGKRITDLRLSGEDIAKIFSGEITHWDDPAIKADNPQLDLPATPIVPVVRSDGAGSSYFLSQWMISQYPSEWKSLCTGSGRPADECGPTSFYPTVPGMVAQSGDLGVSAYVSASYANGAIGYVNYSYALEKGFPVIAMENAAGYYTTPTPYNVAVSLESAQVDTKDVDNPALYLTENLSGVYTDTDPRSYPLSEYSYLILPTTVQGQFSTQAGKTLAAFAYYAMCQGQQEAMSPTLGYSPLPLNLVQAAFQQIRKIPGAVVQSIDLSGCNNPTFTSTGKNKLAEDAPFPPACAKAGSLQCATGTGGDTTPTALIGGTEPTSGGGQSAGQSAGGGTGGGGTGGGSGGAGAGSGRTGSGTPGTGAGASGTAGQPGAGATAGGSGAGPTTGSGAGKASGTGGTGGAASTATPVAASTCAAIPGSCTTSTGGAAVSSTSGGSTLEAGSATSTVLPAPHGWTTNQTVLVLVAGLAVAAIVAPGAASLLLRRRSR